MKVLKFGGTSVGTVESLRNVKNIVESQSEPCIVVVSALGGLTDRLIETAGMAEKGDIAFRDNMSAIRRRHYDIVESLVAPDLRKPVLDALDPLLDELEKIYIGVSYLGELSPKSLNRIVSFGERMSSIIVANIIRDAVHKNSLDFVKTEKWFNKNIASRQLTDRLIKEAFDLPLSNTVIAGGFISTDKDNGEITNLGRGGSDYTAALIAAALDAESLEIWTDVDGFMTADPRIIPDAAVIDNMTFIESMELCSFGAKVIYPPTIYPVFHKNIPIRILNTHNPAAPGTLITDNPAGLPQCVRGVSSIGKTAMIHLSGDFTANVAEINSRAYNAMARNGISVSLVGQPEDDVTFSLVVNEDDAQGAVDIFMNEFAPELQSGNISEIRVEGNLAVIAVVRESIKEVKGLAARLKNSLQREGVDVKAMNEGASETTIAIIVPREQTNLSLRIVHNACFR